MKKKIGLLLLCIVVFIVFLFLGELGLDALFKMERDPIKREALQAVISGLIAGTIFYLISFRKKQG